MINFPAVQPVDGTVNVGNLPVDGQGNLRVAGIASAPNYAFTKIADGLNLVDNQQYTVGPSQVGGWKTAVFYLRMTGLSETIPGTAFCPNFEVLFGGDDFHFPAYSANPICYSGPGTVSTHRVSLEVLGPTTTLKVTTPPNTQGNATLEVWLYLST